MIHLKFISLVGCIVAFAIGCPITWAQLPSNDAGAVAVYRADELKMTLKSDRKVYKEGAPIKLVFTVENISQKQQRVAGYSIPQCSYWVKLTDEKGNEVGTHKYLSKPGGTGSISLPGNSAKALAPSQSIEEKMDLRPIMEVPGPGHYRLRAWRFPLLFYRFDLEAAMRAGKPLDFANSIASNEIEFEIR